MSLKIAFRNSRLIESPRLFRHPKSIGNEKLPLSSCKLNAAEVAHAPVVFKRASEFL